MECSLIFSVDVCSNYAKCLAKILNDFFFHFINYYCRGFSLFTYFHICYACFDKTGLRILFTEIAASRLCPVMFPTSTTGDVFFSNSLLISMPGGCTRSRRIDCGKKSSKVGGAMHYKEIKKIVLAL